MAALRLLLLALVLLALAAPADAQEDQGPLYDTPVYYPPTKSYLELKHFDVGHSIRGAIPDAMWEWGYRLARSQVYKGVRGRLAVLATPEALAFVKETFRPRGPTWIGLRYWCPVNRLQWVTREFFDNKGVRVWSEPWGPPLSYCGEGPYFGVAVGGPYPEGPFMPLLTAWGYKKEFHEYLVEYPTGEE